MESLMTGFMVNNMADVVGLLIITIASFILLARVLSWFGLRMGIRKQTAYLSKSGCDSCNGCGRGGCH